VQGREQEGLYLQQKWLLIPMLLLRQVKYNGVESVWEYAERKIS
jgi:hypothetical protein